MSGNPTYRREQIDQLFSLALPLIDSALRHQYGLRRAEAKEMEQCLREWFHGFVRRPGSPQTLDRLRPHILAMACNAGHVYWSAKPAEEVPRDEMVKRSLSLGPERIAIELEKAQEDREKPDGEPGKEKG